MDRRLCVKIHEAMISEKLFPAVQQEKCSHAKKPESSAAPRLTFCLDEAERAGTHTGVKHRSGKAPESKDSGAFPCVKKVALPLF